MIAKKFNNIRAVAFDCDGVMFDTTEANMAYYNQLLEHVGKPAMTPEQFAFTHMHTVDESMMYLLPEPALRTEATAYRQKMSYRPFLQLMKLESDLKPLLRRLKPDFFTAIATNRSDTMDRVLQTHNLEGLFDMVVTAMDVSRPKPHPDQLEKITRRFGIKPHQTLYIGDSELDQAAAAAAKVPFVAYQNSSLTADVHIDRLSEVADILHLA
jgi:phosphoglycolate phosphatase-like HAD superfamily hydrolase